MCRISQLRNMLLPAPRRQSLMDADRPFLFMLKPHALSSPGRLQRLRALSLNGEGRVEPRPPSSRTHVIWIKVSILLSAPVMLCALSCIHFLFGFTVFLTRCQSRLRPHPPARRHRRSGDLCRKCILLAVHWFARSMVAQGSGLAGEGARCHCCCGI